MGFLSDSECNVRTTSISSIQFLHTSHAIYTVALALSGAWKFLREIQRARMRCRGTRKCNTFLWRRWCDGFSNTQKRNCLVYFWIIRNVCYLWRSQFYKIRRIAFARAGDAIQHQFNFNSLMSWLAQIHAAPEGVEGEMPSFFYKYKIYKWNGIQPKALNHLYDYVDVIKAIVIGFSMNSP